MTLIQNNDAGRANSPNLLKMRERHLKDGEKRGKERKERKSRETGEKGKERKRRGHVPPLGSSCWCSRQPLFWLLSATEAGTFSVL